MRGSGGTESGSGKHVWSVGIRLLHWLTVIVLAAQITVAFFLMGGPGMATMRWLPVHMSLGVSILGVILIRIVWRAFEAAPTVRLSSRIRRLGFGKLPAPTAPRIEGISARDFALIHRSLVYAFLALVGTHIAAALVHPIILRDGILSAMLFGRQEPDALGARPDDG